MVEKKLMKYVDVYLGTPVTICLPIGVDLRSPEGKAQMEEMFLEKLLPALMKVRDLDLRIGDVFEEREDGELHQVSEGGRR